MADKKDDLNISQPAYWKSLRQLHNDPSFIEASRHEFKEGVTDDFDPSQLSGLSRRKFLALVGASAALAGAGCSDYRDKGEIVPYVKKPEEITPGKANYYASYLNYCRCGCGVLIKTREGRPVKVDGNPEHPVSRGKICAKCQSGILGLYNPERLSDPLKRSDGNLQQITWGSADTEIKNLLQNAGNREIAIVTHSVKSPTTLRVLQDFIRKYPSAKIYSYELFSNEIRNSAWKKCYNGDVFPLIKWDEAKVILSLEGDFLGNEGNHIENAGLFARGRDVNNPEKFNRLYVVEGNMSLTGMNADYRLRLRPDAQLEFALSLLNEVSKKLNSPLFGNYSFASFAGKYSISEKILTDLVNDLIANSGTSIIYAGDVLPETVHIAVNYLNEILGNNNLYRNESDVLLIPHTTYAEWKNFISSVNNGRIGAVIHIDCNPVFHLPGDLGYADAIKKIDTVISLVENKNETSALSSYVLPVNNAFESWGDAKTRTGLYTMQQPVISPIHNTRQKEAALLSWAGYEYKENLYHEYLRNNWQRNIYPVLNTSLTFDKFWVGALYNGFVEFDETVSSAGNFNSAVLNELGSSADVSDFAVILKDNYSIGDGRFADNGWLQELPHPVTKVTWDNYAAVSQATAGELGVDYNDLIEVSIDDRKLEIPVFIQPGSADKTITIELGYGRTGTGTVGSGAGFNANVLISSAFSLSPFLYTAARVKKVSGKYEIVTAQEHQSFDDEMTKDAAKKRGIIHEGTLAEYLDSPLSLKRVVPETESMYDDHPYTGVKWGMSIDLNKCIGCGECIIACTAENNIPVVGKDQVKRGREMHWIRIDRYYSGPVDEPVVSNQVMLCQHCDNAPCENVCPVVATTHSPDGLNQMVYNRCVGTRYCSNNCPYKVRRFNFYNFRDNFNDAYQMDKLFSLVYNPEVTVRSRGVMEKCSFCIQRIMEARENATREKRQLKGSDVTTACQDACPSNAIVFGDIKDPESELNRFRNHDLGYYVLDGMNFRPNVTYITKLRNIHKES